MVAGADNYTYVGQSRGVHHHSQWEAQTALVGRLHAAS